MFHAGTDMDSEGALIAVGGRVLSVTATGDDFDTAFGRVYRAISEVDWPTGFCRTDIGWRVRSK